MNKYSYKEVKLAIGQEITFDNYMNLSEGRKTDIILNVMILSSYTRYNMLDIEVKDRFVDNTDRLVIPFIDSLRLKQIYKLLDI